MESKKLGWTMLVLAGVLALSGCNKDKPQDAGCKADSDCKNGTLCEGGMCVPADVAKKARGADKKVEEKKPEVEEKEEEKEPEEEVVVVPLIPTEKSDPPKLPDWEIARQVNTQHKEGLAKECSIKVVREWVRVYCRGDVLGYQDLKEFGKKRDDYYVSVKETTFSLVARIKQGPKQSVRICRKTDRASLVIDWPMDKDRPEHIALGDGKACEGTEYEDGVDATDKPADKTKDAAITDATAEEEKQAAEAEDTDEESDADDKATDDEKAADDKAADGDKADTTEKEKPTLPKCSDVGCPDGKFSGVRAAECSICPPGYACVTRKEGKRCGCKTECSN